MKINNLNDIDDNILCSTQQEIEFKLGKHGGIYNASIERDTTGSIDDIFEYAALQSPKQDVETWIAHLFLTNAEIWYDLDQEVFDLNTNEELVYYLNIKKFINYYEFPEEEVNFLNKISENNYVKVYITIIENSYEQLED